LIRTLLLLAVVTTGSLSGQTLEHPALLSGRGTLAVAGSDAATVLPAGVTLSSIAPLDGAGDWLAAGTEGEARLYLLRGDGSSAVRLAAPREAAATVAEPLPVADETGRLLGLAWLAGRDRDALAVRFAAWEGDHWGPSMTVSAPGPGSQLALAATARAGTVVLAWSSFDGQDDEILSARWTRGQWSPPNRVAPDDATPDVTPALVADAAGFLVVWSGFEGGEYRLFSSRLRGDDWSPPVVLGPPGSLFPALAPTERGHLLLYRDARARAWTVLELDRTGRTLARAHLAAAPDAAPGLLGLAPGGVRLVVGGRATDLAWEAVP
jgi:hypothetical protein